MKKLFLGFIALLLFCPTVYAGVSTIGTGDNIGFDTTGFPPGMVADYKVMQVKCKKCHTLKRVVVAIQTGLAPISNDIFDKDSVTAYAVKMLRKPDSGMNKKEVKKVVDLLNYLLDLASE